MADEDQTTNKAEALQKALAKHQGDAMALATFLFSDNYDLREKNRKLKEQIPAEGQMVISKSESEKLETYKALGKPDELKTRLEAHATMETENAELKRDGQLRDVAQEAGWKVSVLKDRDKATGSKLEYFFKEEGEQKKKVPYVKTEQGEVSLEKYATENWADYLPALKAESQSGTRVHGSTANNAAPPKNLFEKIRDEAKNKQKANERLHPMFSKIPGRVTVQTGD
jgi:hypothetical protein